jgi:hypothetical protein
MKTVVGVFVTCTLSLTAAAQEPIGAVSVITQPVAGDCSLVVTLPSAVSPESIVIALDDPDAVLYVTMTQRVPLVVSLSDPLEEGSIVMVIATGRTLATARVAERDRSSPPVEVCTAPTAPPPPRDDARSDFEASGYIGWAFDNFAPNIVGDYRNIEASVGIKSRWIGGVEAQYRLLGRQGGTYQFWLATQTLHGVRTTDVDCNKTPSVAVCSNNPASANKFLYILGNASTIEAHLDARFEFGVRHPESEIAVRPYVVARFGFLDVEDAPRVMSSDGVGVGMLASKGAYRNSRAQLLWGRSEQFQSNTGGWNRLKLDGVLVFDLAPNVLQRAENFFKRTGGASRFFIAIAIDRNPGGPGPDAVQTYVGFDFDLQRLFSPFGG